LAAKQAQEKKEADEKAAADAKKAAEEKEVEEKEAASKVLVQKADMQSHEVPVVAPAIKNSRGQDVPVEDYFYAVEGQKAVAPGFFNKAVGFPSDREDLIELFDKVFKPEDNFVLLKSRDKEVYSILVPLKYADIGSKDDSVLGDYQVHAISFVTDGSVNYEKFTGWLLKVAQTTKYANR
jgi:hypothetical protein